MFDYRPLQRGLILMLVLAIGRLAFGMGSDFWAEHAALASVRNLDMQNTETLQLVKADLLNVKKVERRGSGTLWEIRISGDGQNTTFQKYDLKSTSTDDVVLNRVLSPGEKPYILYRYSDGTKELARGYCNVQIFIPTDYVIDEGD